MTASGNPVDLVARWMAIGSLAISALSFLYHILKDRRKVSVKANNAHRSIAGENLDDALGITIVAGHRPITITGLSIEFSHMCILFTGAIYTTGNDVHSGTIACTGDSDDLNTRLEDGGLLKVFFDYDQIGQFMANIDADIELKAIYAYDAEHKTYEAKVSKVLRDKIDSLGESDDSS